MINVGVIGFGKMGKVRAQTVEKTGRGKVISVFDANEETDFHAYSSENDYDTIISNQSIDAIFICTPNYLNKPLTIQSLKAGKHVFCEKPPCFNAKEMDEIRNIEGKSGKKLMYGFNHRHHSSVKRMKEIIDSNEFGKVLWMRGRYGKSVDKNFFNNWRVNKELAGGGILLDQGIHMLDLFLYLGGHFNEVKAFVSNLYWKAEIEDNAFVIMRNNETGTVASLHSTMTQWRHLFSLEIFLEKGYMVLNGLKTSSGTYGDELLAIAKNRSTAPAATWEDEERITFHTDISWRSEIGHFFDAIENDTEVKIGNSEDAFNLMDLIDKIYRDGRS